MPKLPPGPTRLQKNRAVGDDLKAAEAKATKGGGTKSVPVKGK